MNGIGWAVKQMRAGRSVRRAGWNGKGMSLEIMPGDTLCAVRGFLPQKYVAMVTTQATMVPWLCSQTDLLAMDWEIAE